MFYKLLDLLNSIPGVPYYFVTPLVYGYGTSADHIHLSICKKGKRKLIILYPNILQSFFKYSVPNKYLLEKMVIEGTPQNEHKILKIILTACINIEFVLRRICYFFFSIFGIKLQEQFRFPLIGIIPIFKKNKSGKYLINTNLESDIDLQKNEITKSESFLETLGITKNDKYVCLHVRDDLYYNDPKRRPFRNSNIENYIDLINHLIKKNYFVIRLGSQNKKFNFKEKKFIDYSSFDNKKDYIELFLIKNCDFFIGTQSGPLSVAALFNKPIYFTNAVRIFESFFPLNNHKSVTILKTVRWKKNNKKISLKEFIQLPALHHHFRFVNNDFIYEENTPDELVKSLDVFINNLDKSDYKLNSLQIKFNNFVKNEYSKKNLILNNEDYMDIFYYYKTKCFLENSSGSFCPLFLEKNFNN